MKLLTVVLTTTLKSDARITTRQSHVIPLFRQMPMQISIKLQLTGKFRLIVQIRRNLVSCILEDLVWTILSGPTALEPLRLVNSFVTPSREISAVFSSFEQPGFPLHPRL